MDVPSISFIKYTFYGINKCNIFSFTMGYNSISEHGRPIFSILIPIIFSLSGFFLSSFAFYSFGILENIKIKVKALDEIYNGKALYREYIATRGEDR